MNQAQVEKDARRLMTESFARNIASADITAQTLVACQILGEELIKAESEYFITRKSLQSYQSNGVMFAIPTDDNGDPVNILRVWDMGTVAFDITATEDNGSGLIRATVTPLSGTTDHGIETDDVVTIHGVLGCTEANGTWKITDISTTTFDLQGSTYANAWTSGGKAFRDEGDDFDLIQRQPNEAARMDDATSYYLRGAYLVVDDNDFDNDIIVSYLNYPIALASIPVRYHFGLPAYVAMTLIELPSQDNPQFTTMTNKFNTAKRIWATCLSMAQGFRPVVESRNLATASTVKRGWI